MSNWIDVKDSLPEIGEKVLTTILLNNGTWSEPEINYWYYKPGIPDQGMLLCTCSFVKKWQPLPLLPKN